MLLLFGLLSFVGIYYVTIEKVLEGHNAEGTVGGWGVGWSPGEAGEVGRGGWGLNLRAPGNPGWRVFSRTQQDVTLGSEKP